MEDRAGKRSPRLAPGTISNRAPGRLIDLYTYENDLVLDPFMGSGSTLVAASRLGRRFIGYDLDPTYVDITRLRVQNEGSRIHVS